MHTVSLCVSRLKMFPLLAMLIWNTTVKTAKYTPSQLLVRWSDGFPTPFWAVTFPKLHILTFTLTSHGYKPGVWRWERSQGLNFSLKLLFMCEAVNVFQERLCRVICIFEWLQRLVPLCEGRLFYFAFQCGHSEQLQTLFPSDCMN